MYLIDTDVISELRKRDRANINVLNFFQRFRIDTDRCFISAITLGELRRGVELIRHRGDIQQAEALEHWVLQVRLDFADRVLPIDQDIAELWGRLRVPDPTNSIDKLVASTAMINQLTVIARNTKHFEKTGVQLLNPFEN